MIKKPILILMSFPSCNYKLNTNKDKLVETLASFYIFYFCKVLSNIVCRGKREMGHKYHL